MPRYKPISVNVIGAVAGAIAIGVLAGACLPAGSGGDSDRPGTSPVVTSTQARTIASRDWVPPIGDGINQGVGDAGSGSPVPMAP